MATPVSGRRRALQVAIAFPVLWVVVCWGAVFDVLYLLQFRAGLLGAAALTRNGWSQDGIALGYQFGYLILPAVTPVALWIVMNQRFLEALVGWRGEPGDEDDGPSAQAAVPAAPPQDSGDRPA